MARHHYEGAPEYDAEGYAVAGWQGIAFHVVGWETEPDEDAEGTGYEVRTGRLVVVMVGDDRTRAVSPDYVTPLSRVEYCAECGQIGCGHSLTEA